MAERVEVVTGVRRRRNWSDEEKLRFVAQTYEPGMSVSEIARRNDLSVGLLFTWKRMAEGRAPRSAGGAGGLAAGAHRRAAARA